MISSVQSAEHAKEQKLQSQQARPTGELIAWIQRYGEGMAALASGIFIAAAWGISGTSHTWEVILYLTAFIVGGFVKAKEGLQTLIEERDLDVNLLMIVAAIGAASIGYWAEGAVLIFIFSLSGVLESYTMERSRRDISSLMELKPEMAVLYHDGEERAVSIEELKLGDIVLVKPGERIPADGLITEGASAVNQAAITGESIPVDKAAGDEVFAGTLNGEGALFIEVSQPSESTLFAKIIRLVQEAQSEKPATQRFIERFERIYARVIIVLSFLLIVVPPFLLAWTWQQSFYKAMVFLVVASPCALVASIMPAMLSAVSNSARKGVLFKGGAHLENLARTKVVAFDKTGTLTTGTPVVTDLIPFQGYDKNEMLQAAASLESLSEHPLAKAIVLRAQEEGLTLQRPTEFTTRTGWGVQAQWKGDTWKIGKPAFLEEQLATEQVTETIGRLEREGKTVTVIHNSRGAVGVIALRDRLRPEAVLTIAALKKQGVKVAMLTGDQRQTAETIAKEAGIDIVYAELLPEDKVARVKELREAYGFVAMVGDGVNDAPALATATVGIAMGTAGSDAALETANVVLLSDDMEKIPEAILLGRRTASIVKQNMIFALSVILLLITANFIQGIPLPLGVVGHEGSTILVIVNGLRLLR
ncbi:heavy metal translocating P-type ATPase [Paenibacillus doosanensis]|uniref:Zinc-transporting ATPase n=1 Tax=Paenibacillus konkukensis TaxID=2020716 RepID=A0ABY4RXI4_9BACL|nr:MULTISPECIES: heavy metal translocating P-type ATPase [Paenibacillus]MCS7460849.1 heavy metal translocating P-type ATPase [Paenibacillus doosanensis]UQZ86263.1 Zinc-transporting ATPase [Paenibacillus konkukensis]